MNISQFHEKCLEWDKIGILDIRIGNNYKFITPNWPCRFTLTVGPSKRPSGDLRMKIFDLREHRFVHPMHVIEYLPDNVAEQILFNLDLFD
jgi:hypothetical protein